MGGCSLSHSKLGGIIRPPAMSVVKRQGVLLDVLAGVHGRPMLPIAFYWVAFNNLLVPNNLSEKRHSESQN